MSALAWGRRLSDTARAAVTLIAEDLGCDPSYVTSIIAFESNWNPAAANAITNATGLIQFMPATAAGLGTTCAALARMSVEEQLGVVRKYFAPYRGRLRGKDLASAYMAVLLPSAIDLAGDAVIFPPGSRAELANRGLDINHDGAVTKAEAAAFVQRRFSEGMLPANVGTTDAPIIDIPAVPQEKEQAVPDTTVSVPSFGDVLSGIVKTAVSVVNPLAGAIVTAFEPWAREKLETVIGAHTSTPEVAAQVTDGIVNIAKQITGATDPVDVLTAIKAHAELSAQIQAQAIASLDAQMPLFDKLAEYDAARWKAEREGKDAAGTRFVTELKAGAWDMTKTLVRTGAAISGFTSVGLVVAIIYQSITHQLDAVLLAFAGPIVTLSVRLLSEVFSYRFDGSKQSDASSAALTAIAKQQTGA